MTETTQIAPHLNTAAAAINSELRIRAQSAAAAASVAGRPGQFVVPADRDATFGIAIGNLISAMRLYGQLVEAIENDWPRDEDVPGTNIAIGDGAAEVARAAHAVSAASRAVVAPFVAKIGEGA